MDITERRAPHLCPKAEASRASLLSLLTDAGTTGVDVDDLDTWADRRGIKRLERVRLVRDLVDDGEVVRAGDRWYLKGRASKAAQEKTYPTTEYATVVNRAVEQVGPMQPLTFGSYKEVAEAYGWDERDLRRLTGEGQPIHMVTVGAGAHKASPPPPGRPVSPPEAPEGQDGATAGEDEPWGNVPVATLGGIPFPGLSVGRQTTPPLALRGPFTRPMAPAVPGPLKYGAKDIADLGERAVAKVDPAQGAYPGPGTLAARVLAFLREAPATTATVVAHFGAQGVVAHSVRGALGTLKARGFLEQDEVTRLYYPTGKERGS